LTVVAVKEKRVCVPETTCTTKNLSCCRETARCWELQTKIEFNAIFKWHWASCGLSATTELLVPEAPSTYWYETLCLISMT